MQQETATAPATGRRTKPPFRADHVGTAKQIGIFWHLRAASGKLVLVHAGQIVFDSLGNVVRITPNVGGDQFAAVICPALGGNPA